MRNQSEREAGSQDLATLQQQVASLAKSVDMLREQVAEQSKAIAALASRLDCGTSVAGQPPVSTSHAHEKEAAVEPEILLVIAATVTAFLGKKVRIRSAKMLQSPYEIINPWAQQGRVSVQASHRLSRG
jgi:hypothetical protein